MSEAPDSLLRCAECRRKPLEHEDPSATWREEFDGVGELYAFCPECWEREFGACATGANASV